jgi:hypothetical protein
MDADRFDRFSRTIAERSSRRQALRRFGSGGVGAALLGLAGVRVAAAQDGTKTCQFQLVATVVVGPDKDSGLEGELTVEIGDDGAIDKGSVKTTDGDTYNVVGQTTGRTIDLRVDLGDGDIMALTGTAEQDLVLCRGRIDGTFGGPNVQDLGTWTASRKASGTPGSGTGGGTGGGTGNGTGNSTGGGNNTGGNNTGGGNSTGSGNSTGGGNSSGGNTGGNSSGGGDGSCASGVVCGGQCCVPRQGYSPDSIACDGQDCACTYSCAAAGCPYGGTDHSFTVGCDDRPDALCGENCNYPPDNGCGDVTCDQGTELDLDSCQCVPASGGGNSSDNTACVDCNGSGSCCEAYAGYTAADVSCQGETCVCMYSCAAANCPNADATSYFTIACTDDPNSACANFGCGA